MTEAQIMQDHTSGRSRGFGYVSSILDGALLLQSSCCLVVLSDLDTSRILAGKISPPLWQVGPL